MAPCDEYVEYADVIAGMLSHGAGRQDVIAYLQKLRRDVLMVGTDDQADIQTAQAVIGAPGR